MLGFYFIKSAYHIFICVGVTLQYRKSCRVSKRLHRYFYHEFLPIILLKKNILSCPSYQNQDNYNTYYRVHIQEKCSITDSKLVHYWIIICVPYFSRKGLFIIYFNIDIISRNNQHFESILFFSYQPFQVLP